MEKYIERMICEEKDLSGKISRAESALGNTGLKLNAKQKELLSEQIGYMKNYQNVLNERIRNEQKK